MTVSIHATAGGPPPPPGEPVAAHTVAESSSGYQDQIDEIDMSLSSWNARQLPALPLALRQLNVPTTFAVVRQVCEELRDLGDQGYCYNGLAVGDVSLARGRLHLLFPQARSVPKTAAAQARQAAELAGAVRACIHAAASDKSNRRSADDIEQNGFILDFSGPDNLLVAMERGGLAAPEEIIKYIDLLISPEKLLQGDSAIACIQGAACGALAVGSTSAETVQICRQVEQIGTLQAQVAELEQQLLTGQQSASTQSQLHLDEIQRLTSQIATLGSTIQQKVAEVSRADQRHDAQVQLHGQETKAHQDILANERAERATLQNKHDDACASLESGGHEILRLRDVVTKKNALLWSGGTASIVAVLTFAACLFMPTFGLALLTLGAAPLLGIAAGGLAYRLAR